MNRLFTTTVVAGLLLAGSAKAQLSSNPDKFLGNITTSYQIDYGTEKFYQLWNQITPENESKWDQIEGSRRGSFGWTNCDNIYRYAKNHHFPFKFHTLVWGSQYPQWMNSLSTEEQYKAIVEWMDAIKKRYPDLQMIDVVNEAVAGHAPAPYKNALGGDGVTGFDWIIKAFEMAHERWPDAILIYNDYNTFQWNTDQFIELVRIIRDAGAPVDAYGCQSHDLTGCSATTLKNSMARIQNTLKMPMYITEYDIGTNDDQAQLRDYKAQIPLLWEADYCAGVTLWGYIYGKTWTNDGKGYSGIIKNGTDRPAMTWLREYMASDKAKSAKSPFPGMVKEASVYVRPVPMQATVGQPAAVEVRAKMQTKTIDHVDLYVNNKLQQTLSEPTSDGDDPVYAFAYTPVVKGKLNLKAVVTATDSTKYERLSSMTAYNERKPHKTIVLPGTLEVEDFDEGGEGLTFHDSDTKDEGGGNYRSDNGGVDIARLSNGYALAYTVGGEWLEYTVSVEQSGYYEYEAVVASGTSGAGFTVSLADAGNTSVVCQVSIPQTDNNQWSTYQTVKGITRVALEAGIHVLRLRIDGANGNIDKIRFTHTDFDPENQTFTDLVQLTGGQPFAIVSREQGKAFYGSDNQNLQFDSYAKAFTSSVSGYYFKLESLAGSSDASIRGYYLLRLIQPDGSEYSIWGSPGYLNTQPVSGTCCFILGLKEQNGQDIKNGAVWDIQYVEGQGFTLKNIGTGKYLHDASPAKYDEPVYFTFCTTGAATGIQPVTLRPTATNTGIYTLQGVRVGSVAMWDMLPQGLYIVNGKKTLKK